MLVCPITKQDLLPANGKLKKLLNDALQEAQLIYADGRTVPKQAAFWVTKNKTTVYSVVDSVPILLETKQVLVPETK